MIASSTHTPPQAAGSLLSIPGQDRNDSLPYLCLRALHPPKDVARPLPPEWACDRRTFGTRPGVYRYVAGWEVYTTIKIYRPGSLAPTECAPMNFQLTQCLGAQSTVCNTFARSWQRRTGPARQSVCSIYLRGALLGSWLVSPPDPFDHDVVRWWCTLLMRSNCRRVVAWLAGTARIRSLHIFPVPRH